ncbi:MAG TPA: polysaccharide biosynthesis tyrosine autokinase [Coleofasciculaceae cyanobacterium]|jgi:capsular exopolysaccharide synthesis family protein
MEPQDLSEDIDIQKYWLVLKRRWLPAAGTFGAVVAVTLFFLLQQKPSYEAEGKLLIKSSRASSLTGLGVGIGELEGLNQQTANPLDTQVEIVRSVPIMQATIEALQLKDEQGNPMKPEDLAEKLSIKGINGTDVLNIGYQAKEPKLAAAVVNKVIEIYISSNVQANRAEAVSAREFIAEQLPETETAVRAADLALRRFKEENGVIVLQEEASAAVRTISELDVQITQAQAQLQDVTAQSQELQRRVGIRVQDAVPLAALSQAPGVQEVLRLLQEAQGQLTVERTRYQPGYPTIVNLERKVSALNTLLKERVQQVMGSDQPVAVGNIQVGELQQLIIEDLVKVESERLGLASRIATLSRAQSTYTNRASILPRLEQTQQELARKLQAAQVTYEALLNKLQEIQVAENQNIGNARIISPALAPTRPVGSKKLMTLAGGSLVGILLAIIMAFTLDLVDRSVKTVKEARELFGYTLLGVIPAIGRGARKRFSPEESEQSVFKMITRDEPRSPISESYQMLQANLKFLSSDKNLKTIVVTSSVAQEGKSEVSANLVVAMAQVGYRVLLVDADMRRPTQHHMWGLTNSTGLSNVMVDQVGLDVAIQEVAANLHVLPSGVIPPNPVALLDSKRMASLISIFSQSYDYVVLDTPPLAGTADAAVLGKMVDGILLVVRPGVVDSTRANAAKEFLAQSGQNILGMVINGVDVKNEPDSYFYYTQKYPEQQTIPQPSRFTGEEILGVVRDRSRID